MGEKMFNLTSCQEIAVNDIFNNIIMNKKKIVFKAPTGSGKTFMMANLINKIIENDESKKIFIFSTLSTGGLNNQNYQKLKEYTHVNGLNYKTYEINSPSSNKQKGDIEFSIPLENNCVYFIGSSSYKKTSILFERAIFLNFIFNAKLSAYKLFYIKDESHIAEFVNSEQALMSNIQSVIHDVEATSEIHISATPKLKADVEILKKDAEKDYLIKSN